MNAVAILWPVCALVALTFAVLLVIPYRRLKAAFAGEVAERDFAYGESARVPPEVSIPNRNYMNLLEIPVLFYVGCLLVFAAKLATPALVATAWIYVALRAAHSLVHLTYNNVRHRLAFFAASSVVLFYFWIRIALAL